MQGCLDNVVALAKASRQPPQVKPPPLALPSESTAEDDEEGSDGGPEEGSDGGPNGVTADPVEGGDGVVEADRGIGDAGDGGSDGEGIGVTENDESESVSGTGEESEESSLLVLNIFLTATL